MTAARWPITTSEFWGARTTVEAVSELERAAMAPRD
jgi:hypothetical protein